MTIIKELAVKHDIDLRENIVSVFFEWCGGNIQKNSAFSSLEKLAVIFRHFKVSPRTGYEDAAKWYPTAGISDHNSDIWNAEDLSD